MVTVTLLWVRRTEEPADVTAEWLKKHVQERIDKNQHETGSEWQDEVDKVMSQDAARLRLYQVTAKGWPTKVHGVSLKSTGAALATMMGAVVVFSWGFRRSSHLRAADMGDDMLEQVNSEENPE